MIPDGETYEESVAVVVMRQDLSMAVPEPMRGSAAELLDSAVVLVSPVTVPTAVVKALLDTSVPAEFAADAWLSEHRRLVFTDGRCRVGGYELRYHERFGVYCDEGE